MDIISNNSESLLADFLSVIQKAPESWMCVHINISPFNEATLSSSGLSKPVLEKIRQVSKQIAKRLFDLGLRDLEGKIFVCEDSDVVALYSTNGLLSGEVLRKLDTEFAAEVAERIFHVFPMKEKLNTLLQLSQAKIHSAKLFLESKHALERVDAIFESNEQDKGLTEHIHKRRQKRLEGIVLVVEDDIISRSLITSALQKEYKVVQARDAKSGLAAYIMHSPNVVLLDIHLPDLSGLRVLDRIMFIDPEAYVLMLSADSAVNNVMSTQAKGAAGFIKKPFLKDKLLKLIGDCPGLASTTTVQAVGQYKIAGPVQRH